MADRKMYFNVTVTNRVAITTDESTTIQDLEGRTVCLLDISYCSGPDMHIEVLDEGVAKFELLDSK